MSYHDSPQPEQLPLIPGIPASAPKPTLEIGDVVQWRTKRKSGLVSQQVDALGRVVSLKRKWAHVRSWGIDYRVKIDELEYLARPDDDWDPNKKPLPDWRNYRAPAGHSER
jgi:hypothetical protein